MISLDSLPELVKYELCSYLSGSAVISLSYVNRQWHHLIEKNRHLLPKKRVTFHMSRGKAGTQIMMNIEQRGFSCYYGIVLRPFRRRENNKFKKADEFNGTDINDLSMENQFEMPMRWVEDIDYSVQELIETITERVDFKVVSLADVTRNDLQFLASALRENRSRVKDLTIYFQREDPSEMAELLNSIRCCEEVKISCALGTDLRSGLLTSNSIKCARLIDIDMEDWRRKSDGSEEDVFEHDEDHDSQIADLRAHSLRLKGTNLTAAGANKLIKQWLDGTRKISGHPGIEISTNILNFNSDEVFRGIQSYAKDDSSDNCFSISRPVNGKQETAHISWYADCFSIYVAEQPNVHDNFEM